MNLENGDVIKYVFLGVEPGIFCIAHGTWYFLLAQRSEIAFNTSGDGWQREKIQFLIQVLVRTTCIILLHRERIASLLEQSSSSETAGTWNKHDINVHLSNEDLVDVEFIWKASYRIRSVWDAGAQAPPDFCHFRFLFLCTHRLICTMPEARQMPDREGIPREPPGIISEWSGQKEEFYHN